MPTGTTEERLSALEAVVFNGLSVNQLQTLISIQSNDSFPYYSASEGKLVKIPYSDLLDILASGDITFIDEDDGGNPAVLTGRILIQQAGITKVIIGKSAQSNQYNDLDGKPSFATEQYVDQAESDANTYTDNIISLLEYNEFQGDFNVGTNTPDLQDSTGIINQEYKVVNAGTGTLKDFGSGDILLKETDIIIFDGSNWEIKVDNNQAQESLSQIPPSNNSPVQSLVLNDRLQRIFNMSGYRVIASVEGVSNSSNITAAAFCFYADGTDRYLLVDFSLINDDKLNQILSSENRVFRITTASTSNLANNDIIGGIKNQAIFTNNEIDSLPGIGSNFKIYEVDETFRTSFSGSENMNIAIDLVGDLNGIISKKITLVNPTFSNSTSIDLLPNLGPAKIYDIIDISLTQDVTVAYNAVPNVFFSYGFLGPTLEIQDTIKFYYKSNVPSFSGGDTDDVGDIITNIPFGFTTNINATGGQGIFVFNITYRIIEL